MPTSLLGASLRLFFSLLYNQLAFAYDWVAWIVSLGHWQEWVYTVLPYLPGEVILEIGPGPGHLFGQLLRLGKKMIGLDASRRMASLCFIRCSVYGIPFVMVNGYAHFVPVANNSVDHIVSTFPAPFIQEKSVLAECFRVLSPGGTLVILPAVVLVPSNPLNRAAAWLFRITGQGGPQIENGLTDFSGSIADIGFVCSSEWQRASNAKVFIIIARKLVKEA